MLENVACISWLTSKSQGNYEDSFNIMKQNELFKVFAV